MPRCVQRLSNVINPIGATGGSMRLVFMSALHVGVPERKSPVGITDWRSRLTTASSPAELAQLGGVITAFRITGNNLFAGRPGQPTARELCSEIF
jgi:hypothetical protein